METLTRERTPHLIAEMSNNNQLHQCHFLKGLGPHRHPLSRNFARLFPINALKKLTGCLALDSQLETVQDTEACLTSLLTLTSGVAICIFDT